MRFISVYVPNGQEIGSDKWSYKLRFYERLGRYLDTRCDLKQPLLMAGDFNVAPDARDVHKPAAWERSVLFHPEARAALERVRARGIYDTFRMLHDEAGRYSWWDYRAGGFQRDDGLRIDQLYASAKLAGRLESASIDREERAGDKASDHTQMHRRVHVIYRKRRSCRRGRASLRLHRKLPERRDRLGHADEQPLDRRVG